MVFQSYAIWPHMNVFRNVSFPLEVRKNKPSQTEIRDRVMRVLEAVALDHLADREATKLSGGQQQRLALARALVMEPKLLLLDEPLSNLDAKLREKMRFELKRMQDTFKLTTIYVTHDQSEALALSDEIAVMNEGRIVQIGDAARHLRAAAHQVRRRLHRHHELPRRNRRRPRGRRGLLERAHEHRRAEGEERPRAAGKLRHFHLRAPGRRSSVGDGARWAGARTRSSGIVDQAVFLGEYMDLKVRLGEYEMLARAHPTLRAQRRRQHPPAARPGKMRRSGAAIINRL